MVALGEIMTSDVFSASANTAVTDVAAAMVRGGFGSAVVLEGAAVSGIFTERDVLRAAASGADLTQSQVSRWMTPDPVTAGPEVDTDDAAELMLGGGFRHLPVVENGELAGIVSLRDLLSTRIGRRATVAPSRGRGRRLWPPGRRQRN
jgi:CBS domain-containing protein